MWNVFIHHPREQVKAHALATARLEGSLQQADKTCQRAYQSDMDSISIGREQRRVAGSWDTPGVGNDRNPVVGVILSLVVLNCEDIALIDVGVGISKVHTLQHDHSN